MNLKKSLGVTGIIAAVLLLFLVGTRAINWSTFWICTAVIAGFAWFVLPKMKT